MSTVPRQPVVGIDGLGHVGLATGLAFAARGWNVVGFDIQARVRKALGRGRATIHEEGLDVLLKAQSRSGRFRVVDSVDELAKSAECLFLCLPTPSGPDGRIDLRPLEAGVAELGRALRSVPGYRLVVVKSTVVPGTTEEVVAPDMRRTSGRSSRQLGVAANPEFLSEGSLVSDALQPSRVVIGTSEPRASRLLRRLYAPFRSPVFELSPSGAELVKYSANSFLALKVSFANEISRVAEAVGTDIDEVMEAVGSDPRIGPRFLKAGPGFGGSCFDKDVRAISRKTRDLHRPFRLAEATLQVNEEQVDHVLRLVRRAAGGTLRGRTVALLGLAFKEGTDDVRESRAMPIAEALLAAGATVRGHDPVAKENFALAWRDLHPRPNARLRLFSSLPAALDGVDLAVLQAPWPLYRSWRREWTGRMRVPLLVDLRRALSPARAADSGLRLVALGRAGPSVRKPLGHRGAR